MLKIAQNLSFSGLYDDNLRKYTAHAKKRLLEKEILTNDVEKVVTDPSSLHLPTRKKRTLHIGHSSQEDKFLTVITKNCNNKAVTVYKKSIDLIIIFIKKHYPDRCIELLSKLGINRI